MCGIFAYASYRRDISVRELLDTLCKGLERLEYRGCDSAGVCFDTKSMDTLPQIIKSAGNVACLSARLANILCTQLHSTTAIAHTRWATHGRLTEGNAHPISSDPMNEFAIVHNGIVSNFESLRREIAEDGFTFATETDTEVIAVLMQRVHGKNKEISFPELAKRIMSQIEGSSSFVIKSNRWYPGELIAATRGLSLVFGAKRYTGDGFLTHDDSSNFLNPEAPLSAPYSISVSSDTAGILTHSKRVYYLEDNDILHITQKSITVFAPDSQKNLITVSRPSHLLDYDQALLTKGKFSHHMLKEVHEQGESIRSVINKWLCRKRGLVKLNGTGSHVLRMKTANRFIFIACGSSHNACLAIAAIFEFLTQKITAVFAAGEFADARPLINHDDVVFFVSQSGETADVLTTVEICRAKTNNLIGIINVNKSTIGRKTMCSLHVNAGPEISVASTKSYTAQITMLTLLGMILISKQNAKIIPDMCVGLFKLENACNETIQSTQLTIQELAKRTMHEKNIFIIGRGVHYATAREACLKMKEIAYVHAEAFHAADLKHGPLALVQAGTIVFCIIGSDENSAKVTSAIRQIQARGGKIIAVHPESVEHIPNVDERIVIPDVNYFFESISLIIPFQLLSYYIALYRGNSIDMPRNLAKSVTVE